jgi:hypothetical protein
MFDLVSMSYHYTVHRTIIECLILSVCPTITDQTFYDRAVNCVMVGRTDKIKHSQSEPDQDLQLKIPHDHRMSDLVSMSYHYTVHPPYDHTEYNFI